MSVQEIETQFVFEIPEELGSTFQRPDHRAATAVGQAIAALFGLPFTAPVNVRIRFGTRLCLLEANGRTPRVPSPEEVHTALLAATTAALILLDARVQTHVVDLKKERQTDA